MSRRLACGVVCVLLQASTAAGQPESRPLPLLDVPFISQSEALCGGAAAAMVLRYWGERGLTSESFSHLVDRSAAGIRTAALADDLQQRGWRVQVAEGSADRVRREIGDGRPVLALIEDRPGTFHYIVLVGWHDRGVIFHDPARTPFRVMAPSAFERRWRAAKHWMLVLTPVVVDQMRSVSDATTPVVSGNPSNQADDTDCVRLIEQGIRQAQARDLFAAEQSLTAALPCPGPAPLRELAGVRVLQRRWPDAAGLAAAALIEDPHDAHAWRLLATSRFLQDDARGALEAWNHVAEPRIDLVQVDGPSRTRHRLIEHLIGVGTGELLTPHAFTRAERRLTELPAAASARLEYRPVPSGLAELHAVVAERPAVPRDRLAVLSAGLSAAASREVEIALSSVAGGGERVELGWRFWRDRPRLSFAVRAPAPWRGVLGLEVFDEDQAFTSSEVRTAERRAIQLTTGDWATRRVAWSINGGLQTWNHGGTFGTTGGAVRMLSLDERADARVQATVWSGRDRFGVAEAAGRWRSSAKRAGPVAVARIQAAAATRWTPPDLWFGGDTGHVRPSLLRAHPALDGGRLRLERFGRALLNLTVEGQRWWLLPGGVHSAVAVFADAARVDKRRDNRQQGDVDAGIGARFTLPGMTGTFRIDIAKGLRDGATALSFVYEPAPQNP